jgi:hypothetical protein
MTYYEFMQWLNEARYSRLSIAALTVLGHLYSRSPERRKSFINNAENNHPVDELLMRGFVQTVNQDSPEVVHEILLTKTGSELAGKLFGHLTPS